MSVGMFYHSLRRLCFSKVSSVSNPAALFRRCSTSAESTYHGSLTYVQRIKMLHNLREKGGINEQLIREGRCMVFFKGNPLLTDDYSIAWMDFEQMGMDVKSFIEHAILIGLSDDGRLQFSVQIGNLGSTMKIDIVEKSKAHFTDFRLSLMMMPHNEAGLTSKAKAMSNWHRKNTHCANCGSPSFRNVTGSCRTCSSCKEVWYPSLCPVGIVLVADQAKSRILLVRQGRHVKGMYSCIAGYVDLGETIEEGIRREVAEEVGMTVLKVEYVASQHWSFPTSNLMIGCHATVTGDEPLDMDTMELEDARWFPVDEVKEALSSIKNRPLETMAAIKHGTGQFFVPPRGTLAHGLIDTWLAGL